MAHTLLLIEDDERLAKMVVDYLEASGFRVRHAATGQAGLQTHEQHPSDAIILDLMLPDMDGLDVCRSIRATAQTPILMLTARGEAMDRIIGLELGADDYLPKPFEPRELLARLKAILRRGASVGVGGDAAKDVLQFGRLEIDRDAREVRLDGTPSQLTGHQFEMLRVLAEHPGRVLSREQIMDLVRGDHLEAFDRSIDVHISRIRQAIEDNPKEPRRIITVRGAGYVFAKAQE
ncbi:MAG: response regulator transcription factor [Filomicrobium sp.]